MLHPLLITLGTALCGCALLAQEKPAPTPKGEAIQDNSFLVEEAYNQEAGVVQHISTFQRMRESRDWFYTFTQEWPVPGNTHQLSFTLPYQGVQASPDGRAHFGDILLNYRYQLLGDGDAKVAVAPRFSVILPTGDERQLRGNGALGYQFEVPLSVVLSEAFVAHTNVGYTWTPKAKNADGEKADLRSLFLGQSLVWLATPTFNGMLEVAYTRGEQVAAPGRTAPLNTCFVSPGIRWAYNFKSGLQIEPGIAVPIGVGPSRGEKAIFLYLSFEHPMWNPK